MDAVDPGITFDSSSDRADSLLEDAIPKVDASNHGTSSSAIASATPVGHRDTSLHEEGSQQPLFSQERQLPPSEPPAAASEPSAASSALHEDIGTIGDQEVTETSVEDIETIGCSTDQRPAANSAASINGARLSGEDTTPIHTTATQAWQQITNIDDPPYIPDAAAFDDDRTAVGHNRDSSASIRQHQQSDEADKVHARGPPCAQRTSDGAQIREDHVPEATGGPHSSQADEHAARTNTESPAFLEPVTSGTHTHTDVRTSTSQVGEARSSVGDRARQARGSSEGKRKPVRVLTFKGIGGSDADEDCSIPEPSFRSLPGRDNPLYEHENAGTSGGSHHADDHAHDVRSVASDGVVSSHAGSSKSALGGGLNANGLGPWSTEGSEDNRVGLMPVHLGPRRSLHLRSSMTRAHDVPGIACQSSPDDRPTHGAARKSAEHLDGKMLESAMSLDASPAASVHRLGLKAIGVRELVLLLASFLVMFDHLTSLWLAMTNVLESQQGWLLIHLVLFAASWTVQGLFVTLEEWLNPYVRSPYYKFWIGFFGLHIPWSTILVLKEMVKDNLKKTKAAARLRTVSLTHYAAISKLDNRVGFVDMFPDEARHAKRVLNTCKSLRGPSQSNTYNMADLSPEREYQVRLTLEHFLTQGALTRLDKAAAWLRLVQCIFESIPLLAFHLYVLILSREVDIVRNLSISIAVLSLSVNLAVFCSENQPTLRKAAIFAHVCGQVAMRTAAVSWLAVAQSEKSLPVFVAYAIISLMFSTYFFGSLGAVIGNLFAVPLWFLAWDTTRAKNNDMFGWKTFDHAMEDIVRIRVLRFMVLWRFLENILAVLLAVYLPPLNPCTRLTSEVRYLSPYCMACCRGPIVYSEIAIFTVVTSFMYIGSWFAGWWLDNYFYNQKDPEVDINEDKLVSMVQIPRQRRTASLLG